MPVRARRIVYYEDETFAALVVEPPQVPLLAVDTLPADAMPAAVAA